MHFRLSTTSRVAHFTIVQELLAEYFEEGSDSNLHVVDLPISIEDDDDVAKWTSKAAERVRWITRRKREHVVVFVTTHSDPVRGDLWTKGSEDPDEDPCAVTVGQVSTGVFNHIKLILNITPNSGSA
jgi:hypothetical protein